MEISILFLSCFFSVFVVDSTIYHVDIEHEIVDEINFPESIIDYVTADFTYIVTPDCLYKIDPARAQIIDRTPLPLRFNHVLLRGAEVILISTDEIIVLDRTNLAFKSGIGIERGDHRPLIQNQTFAGIHGHAGIILLSDDGLHSTLRKVDLESGRTIARLTLGHIKSVAHHPQDGIFIGLEEGGNLVIFDLLLSVQNRIRLHFNAIFLARRDEDLYIVSDHGVFLMTKDGTLIDFQPLPGVRNTCASAVVTDEAIFWLDALTFRVCGWLRNSNRIIQLLRDAGSDRIIGIDPGGGMYAIENTPARATRLRNYRRVLAQVVTSSPRADSLWYVQLGAFSDQANALLMYEEFRSSGIPVFVDTADLYRIKFGGFTDKPAALDVVEAMKLDGWLVFQPIKYRDESAIFYVGVEKFIINEGIVRKE